MKKLVILAAMSLSLFTAGFWDGVAKASQLPVPNSGTISLNESNVALGDTVTFTTSFDGKLKNPRIEVLCYQNSVLVYGEGGSAYDTFLLGGGGSLWKDSGGPADCVANLYYFKVGTHEWNGSGQQETVYLATTSFSAAG